MYVTKGQDKLNNKKPKYTDYEIFNLRIESEFLKALKSRINKIQKKYALDSTKEADGLLFNDLDLVFDSIVLAVSESKDPDFTKNLKTDELRKMAEAVGMSLDDEKLDEDLKTLQAAKVLSFDKNQVKTGAYDAIINKILSNFAQNDFERQNNVDFH